MINGQAFGSLPVLSLNDIIVQDKINPGVVLKPSPQEVGGLQVAIRELSGQIYQMVNADLDTAGNFTQIDDTKPSSAFVVTWTGAIVLRTAPANSPYPLVWTTTGSLLTSAPYFYVGFYGAPTDGITDAYPAIMAAYNAALANGGGTVLLGPYPYKVNQMPTWNTSDVNLLGMGEGTSVIVQGFVGSATNPAILMAGPQSKSCQFSQFSLKGPGLFAPGSLPGPSTLTAPNLGTGWAFLNFGGTDNHLERITANGCFHGFGGIIFNGLSFQNLTIHMGGQQMTTQYAICAQGRAGTDAQGLGTLVGVPTIGDTVGCIFDDGQGNVIDTGPYTVTAGDASGGQNATALSLQSFFNQSDAVIGPTANWDPVVASTNTLQLSIGLLPAQPTPTYRFYSTGVMSVTPAVTTAVTGGSLGGNPQSFPFSVRYCNVPQAEYNAPGPGGLFQSTEAVHIDGGVQSWSVLGLGTTGVQYGVRVVNQNSGNTRNSSLCSIAQFSFDHTSVSGISLESGGGCDIRDGEIIANFGNGSPINNYALNIAPTYAGGVTVRGVEISNCASGGIGIGANCIIENNHIFAVGKGAQSCINLQGSNDLSGVMIRSNKLGLPNIGANPGLGTQKYAIDLDLHYTGHIRSLTIEGNDCEGRLGAFNGSATMAASFATYGIGAFITIRNNPGINPILTIADPPIPPGGALSSQATVNPFGCDCLVTIIPDGVHAITGVVISNSRGATKTFNPATAANEKVQVMCPANCSILPNYLAIGTASWYWQTL